MSGWISVCGWRRFQHYDPAKRVPPWIKNHTELMSNDDYLSLPGHTRSILHGLWLEYASSRCRLRADSSSLSSRLHLRVTTAHLESLCDAGWIEIVASKTLAEGYHDASARAHATEAEEEEETYTPPNPPQGGNGRISVKGYTGCRLVRGTHGIAHVRDPLGRDRPPTDWQHERPTRDEIRKALEKVGHA